MVKTSKARLERNGTDQLKVLSNSDHKHQEGVITDCTQHFDSTGRPYFEINNRGSLGAVPELNTQ